VTCIKKSLPVPDCSVEIPIILPSASLFRWTCNLAKGDFRFADHNWQIRTIWFDIQALLSLSILAGVKYKQCNAVIAQ